jgi:hypothetical protein
VNANEVVINEVPGDRGHVIPDLFAERIRQARKAAHVHPRREVLALDTRMPMKERKRFKLYHYPLQTSASLPVFRLVFGVA